MLYFNGKLYFSGIDANKLSQVFCVDTSGNQMDAVTNFQHVANQLDIRVYKIFLLNNKLYIQTSCKEPALLNSQKSEMYISDDGSPHSAQPFSGLPSTINGSFDVDKMTVYNNKLYYFFDATVGLGGVQQYQLWVSDGSQGGAAMIKQFPQNTSASYSPIGYHGKVYFSNNDPSHGLGLYAIDQSNTISFIKGMPAWPQDFFVYNDKLNFFSSPTEVMSDGTTAGTHSWLDNNNQTYQPSFHMEYNNKIYFGDSKGNLGFFDGVSVTTIKTFAGAFIYDIYGCGNKLFFSFSPAPTASLDLWTSDGTANGTALYKTLYPAGSIPRYLAWNVGLKNGKTVFLVQMSNATGQLWEIDPNNNFTVTSILPGAVFPNGYPTLVINNTLFTICNYNNSGLQLFKFNL